LDFFACLAFFTFPALPAVAFFIDATWLLRAMFRFFRAVESNAHEGVAPSVE
jgi:hypothetical protein